MATTAFMATAGEMFATLTLLTISVSAFAAAGRAAAFLPGRTACTGHTPAMSEVTT